MKMPAATRAAACAAAAAVTAISGCASFASAQPAVLVAPTQACVNEMQAAVRQHTGRQVTLSASGIANLSQIVITPALTRDAEGRPLDGRMRADSAVTLRIERKAGQCSVRIDPPTATVALDTCRCAEPGR
jgi:hypothetical protein